MEYSECDDSAISQKLREPKVLKDLEEKINQLVTSTEVFKILEDNGSLNLMNINLTISIGDNPELAIGSMVSQAEPLFETSTTEALVSTSSGVRCGWVLDPNGKLIGYACVNA